MNKRFSKNKKAALNIPQFPNEIGAFFTLAFIYLLFLVLFHNTSKVIEDKIEANTIDIHNENTLLYYINKPLSQDIEEYGKTGISNSKITEEQLKKNTYLINKRTYGEFLAILNTIPEDENIKDAIFEGVSKLNFKEKKVLAVIKYPKKTYSFSNAVAKADKDKMATTTILTINNQEAELQLTFENE